MGIGAVGLKILSFRCKCKHIQVQPTESSWWIVSMGHLKDLTAIPTFSRSFLGAVHILATVRKVLQEMHTCIIVSELGEQWELYGVARPHDKNLPATLVPSHLLQGPWPFDSAPFQPPCSTVSISSSASASRCGPICMQACGTRRQSTTCHR